ncbi:MAG: glycosyltransferase family 4 protein [Gemmatimonadales bacterium]
MNLLVLNPAVDADDPVLGFATGWIRALAARHERVCVITMRAGRTSLPANVRVLSVGKERGYSEARRVVEFYRHLRVAVDREGVEACFSHMIPVFTILAAPVLRPRRILIVTWYAHPSLTWSLRAAHHLSDRVVASLPTAYPYRRDKLVVVGQGIDTNLFAPDSAPERPALILCAGRLSPVKNHYTLLEAAARLRDRRRIEFRVVVLGGPGTPRDAPYVEALRRRVEALNLADLIRLEPAVPIAELPAWYRRCAVHVNLTPGGFGDKVAWEAMACGRPCLVANPGFRETLGEHADRLLFRYGDPEDLMAKLEHLLGAPAEERDAIGRDLRRRVVERHSLTGLADRLSVLFQTLAEARS